MAKRKRSTALFEVITKPQPYTRIGKRSAPCEGLLSGAGKWLKRRLHVDVGSTTSPASTGAKPIVQRSAPIVVPSREARVAVMSPSIDTDTDYAVDEPSPTMHSEYAEGNTAS